MAMVPMTLERSPATRRAGLDADRPIRIWLYVVAAMIFAMVVVGGATRLTGSGLSITEWAPILGVIPPLDHADWLAAFERADIPATPLNTLETLFDDPHLAQVGMFRWTDHPSEGRVRAMRPPAANWSATPPAIRRHAPRLGEHSAEILAELEKSGS